MAEVIVGRQVALYGRLIVWWLPTTTPTPTLTSTTDKADEPKEAEELELQTDQTLAKFAVVVVNLAPLCAASHVLLGHQKFR